MAITGASEVTVTVFTSVDVTKLVSRLVIVLTPSSVTTLVMDAVCVTKTVATLVAKIVLRRVVVRRGETFWACTFMQRQATP